MDNVAVSKMQKGNADKLAEKEGKKVDASVKVMMDIDNYISLQR